MIICEICATKLPVPLTVLSSINIGIFLSLYKRRKTQKDFLIENETEIHQIF